MREKAPLAKDTNTIDLTCSPISHIPSSSNAQLGYKTQYYSMMMMSCYLKEGNYAMVSMVSYIRSARACHCVLHKILKTFISMEKVPKFPPEYNGNIAFELPPSLNGSTLMDGMDRSTMGIAGLNHRPQQ